MSRDDKNNPAITNSFTAFAFAPGELKTTIPCSIHFSIGILFTPAPALPTANKESANFISCILKLRKRIASGLFISVPIS